MSKFEVLVATVNSNSEDLISKMNISSNAIIANQTNIDIGFKKIFSSNREIMIINHPTLGVGKNRNLALTFSKAEILLFSDDDVELSNDYEMLIISAFNEIKNADAIIFNLSTDSINRKQYLNNRVKKLYIFSRMPYGACRIAVRRDAILKANIHFSELFGGGCIFPSGEDSIFLHDMICKKLSVYVSPQFIGKVNFDTSSWFSGTDEKYFFGKGAMYQATFPLTKIFRRYYISFRVPSEKLTFLDKLKWIKKGEIGFKQLKGFNDFIE